jgi:hypothetical protein
MACACRISRLAVFVLEGEDHRHERLLGRLPGGGIGIGEDQLPVRDHLQIDAVIGMVVTVGIPHHDEAGAAGANIELGFGRGPWARRKPLLQNHRIGPGLEDLVARRIDQAGENKLAFAGSCLVGHVCLHRFVPVPERRRRRRSADIS